MRDGEERPTPLLRIVDGVLQQEWEVGYCRGAGRIFVVETRTEWRDVPSLKTAQGTGKEP